MVASPDVPKVDDLARFEKKTKNMVSKNLWMFFLKKFVENACQESVFS